MDDQDKKSKYTYEELRDKYVDQKPNATNSNTKNLANDYNMIVSFIISVLLFIGIGLFAGNYLDNLWNTKPLFILIFIFLGIGAAYRNLYKSITKHSKGSSQDGRQ